MVLKCSHFLDCFSPFYITSSSPLPSSQLCRKEKQHKACFLSLVHVPHHHGIKVMIASIFLQMAWFTFLYVCIKVLCAYIMTLGRSLSSLIYRTISCPNNDMLTSSFPIGSILFIFLVQILWPDFKYYIEWEWEKREPLFCSWFCWKCFKPPPPPPIWYNASYSFVVHSLYYVEITPFHC